jgi:DNA-binding transcriptional MerR regulator
MSYQRYDMLTIGGFASAARLSLKALRLYDQLGILKPSYVDPESGYRYYHVDQLYPARLIRMMRQTDMPLATIRQVLAAAPADAEALVRGYWEARERRMVQARQVLHEVVAYLRKEVAMIALEVSVKTVEPQPIMSVTRRLKVEQLDGHIRDSLGRLYALAEAQGSVVSGPPFGIYHGPVNHDDDGPIEVCLPVRGVSADADDVVARELAGGTVAYVMLNGDQCEFPAVLEGYDSVYDWIRQNGYQIVEPPREIWHSQPGEASQFEVAWLFREPTAE